MGIWDVAVVTYRFFVEVLFDYYELPTAWVYGFLLVLFTLVSTTSIYFLRAQRPAFRRPRAQKLLDPSAKELLFKIDEAITLTKTSIVLPATPTRGWNVHPPSVVDLSAMTDDKYLTWETDREAVHRLIAEIASGMYLENEDISFVPRHIEYTWVSNDRRSTATLVDWNFSIRKPLFLFRENQEGVWVCHKNLGTVGTCHVVTKTEFQHYLMNVYTTRINGKVLVRSGSIDSNTRLRQFVQVLVNVMPNSALRIGFKSGLSDLLPKTRVCSISLVSTSKFASLEREIAIRQHGLLTGQVWDKLGVDLIHMNYQMSLNKVFGVSVGELTSRDINEPSIVRLTDWLLHDHPGETLDSFKIQTGLPYTKYLLLQAVVKAHRELFTQTRVQEMLTLLLYLLLNDIVVCINCKSGCDRTGLVFALATALCQILETRPREVEEIADVVLHYDELCLELRAEFEAETPQNAPPDEQLVAYRRMLDEKLRNEAHPHARKQLLALEIQNCIFANMMAIGLPITIFSTGVCGFKYGKDSAWFKNPHITAALPFFVLSGDCVYSQVQFRKFLVGASSLRGGSA